MKLDKQTELLYLLAILPEGTDAVERITARVILYRDKPTSVIEAMLARYAKGGKQG